MNDAAKRLDPGRADLISFTAAHFFWQLNGKVAHPQPPRAAESADARVLCWPARHLPRPRLSRRQGRCGDRRQRQFLLRRRSARDHREPGGDAAFCDMGGPLAFTRCRRRGQGGARLFAIDGRGRRPRRLRGRRNPRHGVRPALLHGAQQRRISLCASGGSPTGRLQYAHAHHWRRPRLRTALYPPPWTAARWNAGTFTPACATPDAAREIARRQPTFAQGIGKRAPGIEDAIDAEAHAQAICMRTKDYRRAYEISALAGN